MGDFGDDFGAFGAVPATPILGAIDDDWDAVAVPPTPVVPIFISEFDEEFDAFKSNSNLHGVGTAQEVADSKASRLAISETLQSLPLPCLSLCVENVAVVCDTA